jgi:hypothetical protein
MAEERLMDIEVTQCIEKKNPREVAYNKGKINDLRCLWLVAVMPTNRGLSNP